MKNAILLTVLSLATASSTLFAQPRFSIGIGIGAPAPQYYEQTPNYAYSGYDSGQQYDYQPPCPGPGYFWTAGSWYPSGGRRLWRAGYWAPPVYRGYSTGPRYYNARSYGEGNFRSGYENGYRNNFNGDGRGYQRDHDRDHDRDRRDNFRGEHRR